MDFNRIIELSGLTEEEEFDDASYEMTRKIESFIKSAFTRIKLEINYDTYSVNYDHESRRAEVKLEDFRFDLAALNRLYETGLSDRFEIVAASDSLVIEFIVSSELDSAEMSPAHGG